jgi:hypothetical protein
MADSNLYECQPPLFHFVPPLFPGKAAFVTLVFVRQGKAPEAKGCVTLYWGLPEGVILQGKTEEVKGSSISCCFGMQTWGTTNQANPSTFQTLGANFVLRMAKVLEL